MNTKKTRLCVVKDLKYGKKYIQYLPLEDAILNKILSLKTDLTIIKPFKWYHIFKSYKEEDYREVTHYMADYKVIAIDSSIRTWIEEETK